MSVAAADLNERACLLVTGAFRNLRPGASLTAAVGRLAERSGLSARKIDSIRRREPCRVRPEEIAALTRAAGEDHANNLDLAARSLLAVDPIAYRKEAARLRGVARALRGLGGNRGVAP